MKKLILTFVSILFIFSALAQKSKKADLITEFQMNLRNNGFFFPVGLAENLILPTLRFRYFLQDDLAIRADVNVAIQSTEVNAIDDLFGSGNIGSRTQNMNTTGLGVGVEKHLVGSNKFSPFIGLGGSFALGTVTSEYTDFDPTTNRFLDGNTGSTENKGVTFSGGFFAGADYWVTSSFYLGAQVGAQYVATNSKDGFSIENGVEEVNKGGTNRAINFYAIPNFRVGYNFNWQR